MSGWTEERSERAKKLWLDGWSASQIAKDLGGVSRNAVIGRLTRLGLAPSHASVPKPRASAPRVPQVQRRLKSDTASARNIGRTTRSDGTPVSTTPPQPIVERAARGAAAPLMVSLADLGAHMCKWPIGDPAREDFGFCGHRAETGPYCPAHEKAAANPRAKPQDNKSLERMIHNADRRRAA